MTLAEKMIDYRAKHKISSMELAKRIGLTQTTVLRIENGKKCRAVTEKRILNVIEKGE